MDVLEQKEGGKCRMERFIFKITSYKEIESYMVSELMGLIKRGIFGNCNLYVFLHRWRIIIQWIQIPPMQRNLFVW